MPGRQFGGFTITSFVAHAQGRESQRQRLARSFRYETDRGAWVHLCATAPRESAWRTRTEEHLHHAGYETWLTGDTDVDVRRWLTRSSEYAPELALLEAMGTRAAPGAWPRRRTRDAASPLARPRFLETIERVRESVFRPSECWLSGRVQRATRVGNLEVSASFVEAGRFAFLSASIVDTEEPRRPLPVGLHRKLRRLLDAEGYEQSGRQPPGQRTAGWRKVVSPDRVIAETKRIHEVMTAHLRAIAGP